MDIKCKEITLESLKYIKSDISILPNNYLSLNENHKYSSTALSFYKYMKNKIKDEEKSIDFYDEPLLLEEKRSGDWFAPILYISSNILIPLGVSMISNYLTDYFRGQRKPKATIKIVHKNNKGSMIEASFDISAEDVDNLDQEKIKAISNTIQRVINEE